MVQLSQSQYSRLSTEKSMKLARQQVEGSPPTLKALPAVLSSANTPYQAYETYIDNGLICLKHKIRNIEKKKIKLEDYKDRRNSGETLNADQLEAVEKYDETIHHLEFAKELHKTFAALSQDLLKAQKKILRRETIVKLEAEKKKLCTVFQVQYILEHFCEDHVLNDFQEGTNGALHLTSTELDHVTNFSKLACPKRDEHLSLEGQMEQISQHFFELLEASEKSVARSTYKNLKDLLAKILDCGYFESIPELKIQEKARIEENSVEKPETKPETPPQKTVKTPESPVICLQSNDIHPCEFLNRRYLSEADHLNKDIAKSKPWESDYIGKPLPLQPWNIRAEIKEQEPKHQQPPEVPTVPLQRRSTNLIPKNMPWEMRIEQKLPSPIKVQPSSPQPQQALKPARAVNLVPKEVPRQVEAPPKERRERQQKLAPEEIHKQEKQEQLEVEVICPAKVVNQPAAEFCSSSSLPNDPALRKQKLQDLMTQIQGTCIFMQESVLESDTNSQSAAAPSLQVLASPIADAPEEKHRNLSDNSLHSPQIGLGAINGSRDSLAMIEEAVSASANGDLSSMVQVAQTAISLPQATENYVPPEALYPSSIDLSETEQRNGETSLTASPLSSDQPMTSSTQSSSSMSPASKVSAFQSPPPSNNSVNISAAPFQAMQTVFKVNAPLPQRKELEMKDESLYPAIYNQTFTTTSTQTAPQTALSTSHSGEHDSFESLSAPGAFGPVEDRSPRQRSKDDHDVIPYQSDGTVPMSNGSVPFYPAQANTFARNTPPYLNNRGSVRGAARGGRGVTNSYRSPSGYKGFDGYRGPATPSNGNCSQPQYSGREYPGVQYVQRDGSYQQGYKRGTSGGQRANSRGARRGNSQKEQWTPTRGRDRGPLRKKEGPRMDFQFDSQWDMQMDSRTFYTASRGRSVSAAVA